MVLDKLKKGLSYIAGKIKKIAFSIKVKVNNITVKIKEMLCSLKIILCSGNNVFICSKIESEDLEID